MRRCIRRHLHRCVSARKKSSLRYQPWYRNGTVSGLTFVGSCRSLVLVDICELEVLGRTARVRCAVSAMHDAVRHRCGRLVGLGP